MTQLPHLPNVNPLSAGLQAALNFPLIAALLGRRSRRFPRGGSLPDGPLAYTSSQEPLPLSEVEQLLLLTTMTGNTGWHYLLPRQRLDLPHVANYSAAAGGRTFPRCLFGAAMRGFGNHWGKSATKARMRAL